MLTVRLLLAGSFLLAMLKIQGKRITLPWRQKVWARQLLFFGVFGMLGVQYTFVASINTSNAVIATLFQFLSTDFYYHICNSIAKDLATDCAGTWNVRDTSRIIPPID